MKCGTGDTLPGGEVTKWVLNSVLSSAELVLTLLYGRHLT